MKQSREKDQDPSGVPLCEKEAAARASCFLDLWERCQKDWARVAGHVADIVGVPPDPVADTVPDTVPDTVKEEFWSFWQALSEEGASLPASLSGHPFPPAPLRLYVGQAVTLWGTASSAAAACLAVTEQTETILPSAVRALVRELRAALVSDSPKIAPDVSGGLLDAEAQHRHLCKAVAIEAGSRLKSYYKGLTRFLQALYDRPDPVRAGRARPVMVWCPTGERFSGAALSGVLSPIKVSAIYPCRLLRYESHQPESRKRGEGKPVLLVPSLVNAAYILDLAPGLSLIEYLCQRGFTPYLLEWAGPDSDTSGFTVEDYITERLLPAFDEVCRLEFGDRQDGKVSLVGYCMGGTIAAAAAALRADRVAGLALLASPWDTSGGDTDVGETGGGETGGGETGMPALLAEALLAAISPYDGSLSGSLPRPVPGVVLQSVFAGFDPGLHPRKFRKVAQTEKDSPQWPQFLALESWAGDLRDIAPRVVSECVRVWYQENRTGRGYWTVCGTPVQPKGLAVPVFIAAPQHDKIVPPASALAFAADRQQAGLETLCIEPAGGHVAMIAGRTAEQDLWMPLAAWLTCVCNRGTLSDSAE